MVAVTVSYDLLDAMSAGRHEATLLCHPIVYITGMLWWRLSASCFSTGLCVGWRCFHVECLALCLLIDLPTVV